MRRHEPHPALQVAVRHGIGAGLEGIAARGAGPSTWIGRIGQHVIEALGKPGERGDSLEGRGDVGLDRRAPGRQGCCARFSLRASSASRGFPLDHANARIAQRARATASPDHADAGADVEHRAALACAVLPPPATRRRARRDSRSRLQDVAAHRREKHPRSLESVASAAWSRAHCLAVARSARLRARPRVRTRRAAAQVRARPAAGAERPRSSLRSRSCAVGDEAADARVLQYRFGELKSTASLLRSISRIGQIPLRRRRLRFGGAGTSVAESRLDCPWPAPLIPKRTIAELGR